MNERRLGTPLLYISGYLETHRSEYYERLQAVRESGRIQEWLQFFLTAVRRSADDAVRRAELLVALRERYLSHAAKTRSQLSLLVELVFVNPYLTTYRVHQRTGLSDQGARNLLKEAEKHGWIEPVGRRGRGGRVYWLAHELFDIINAPAAYE